jgi:hypothetical protein
MKSTFFRCRFLRTKIYFYHLAYGIIMLILCTISILAWVDYYSLDFFIYLMFMGDLDKHEYILQVYVLS